MSIGDCDAFARRGGSFQHCGGGTYEVTEKMLSDQAKINTGIPVFTGFEKNA